MSRSPKEIIHIQVGECGNKIGNKFFESIAQEHSLEGGRQYIGDAADRQLDGIHVHYRENRGRGGRSSYTPRAIVTDLDPSTMDIIRSGGIGATYKPSNMVFGRKGAGQNFAKGHFSDGAELIEEVLDVIRHEIEDCDNPQGFQITQSLGGGTGAGFGTLILQHLRDLYPDRVMLTYSVFPSPKVFSGVTAPYNAALAMHELMANADATVLFDNEALLRCAKTEKRAPEMVDLNNLIGRAMCGFSAPMRFPSEGLKLHSTLQKVTANMIPDKRLHFLSLGMSPLGINPDKYYRSGGVATINMTNELFSAKNNLCDFNPAEGKYLRAAAIYRRVKRAVVEGAVTRATTPNNFTYDAVNYEHYGTPTPSNATLVSNNTGIAEMFQRLTVQFGRLYRRKSFVHFYTGQGMDEVRFREADMALRQLINAYMGAKL